MIDASGRAPEATHGIADSLLSVLAHRAADITHDILTHRPGIADGHRDPGRGAPVAAARLSADGGPAS